MGCPPVTILGQTLPFWIDTHDRDTAESTDADSLPTYRIYEMTSGTAMVTGTMTLSDNANTTGHYVGSTAVTVANGYEINHGYGILCMAQVNTHPAALTFAFWVLDDLWNKDGTFGYDQRTDSLEALHDILVQNAVAGSVDPYELTVVRGDSYDSDADNAITALGDISARTKLWIVVKKAATHTDNQAILFCEETAGITRLNGAAYGTAAHSVITVSDAVAGDIRWRLDEAVTDDLGPGLYHYDIQTLDASGNVKTWRRMVQFTVQADVARIIA